MALPAKTAAVVPQLPRSKLSSVELWRQRLFPNWWQGSFTAILLMIVGWFCVKVFDWGVVHASFLGSGPDDCKGEGACWVFVGVRFKQFMVGLYPQELIWRPVVAAILVFSAVFVAIKKASHHIVGALLLGMTAMAISGVILYGGFLGFEVVETRLWGGLMLTLLISGVGIIGSLPLGIALALGRKSQLPLVKLISTLMIEFWRGVPLVSVLFMSSVMLPLFMPQGVQVDKLLRAMIGVVLFAGAYMAEVIRGGLQALPTGQYEAAASLGLSQWDSLRAVILPQALRHVIPGILNVFIALVKDTSLVLIIGMFDLLGMVQAALADPQWLAVQYEGYAFAGLLFWVICFSLSRYGLRLERRQQNPVKA